MQHMLTFRTVAGHSLWSADRAFNNTVGIFVGLKPYRKGDCAD